MGKQGEIDYFGALSEHAQQHAIGKPFSDAQCGTLITRIGQVMALLPPTPARILDLGCGTGWTSSFLARLGYQVVGVDIAPDMIQVATQAKDQMGLENLSFQVADYESLQEDSSVDGVVFFDSLHHAEDEMIALEAAFSALRPGGVCVVAEPGIGHHETEASLHAVEAFGVNEKEMPPTKVIRMARNIGFSSWRVRPNHGQLLSLLNAADLGDRKGLLGLMLRLSITRPLIASALILGGKYVSGVVVLEK